MKEFIVTRTSNTFTNKNARPCWEATPKTITYNWFGKPETKIVWVVQFVGLSDIMSFASKYGSIIIKKEEFGGYPSERVAYDAIEIYDDYRE